METKMLESAVNTAIGQINPNIITSIVESRRRSGSTPNRESTKKTKESDMISITTMAGTQPFSSARKIAQVQHRDHKGEHDNSFIQRNVQQMKKKIAWKLNKNGSISSKHTDLTTVKYYFIKVANEKKLAIMRDLDNIVTVKSSSNQSMSCFFKYCLPIGFDHSVYQLERSMNSKGSRVKIVFISGNEANYEELKVKFNYELWTNKVLQLEDTDAIKLVCANNKNIFKASRASYEKAYKQCQVKNLDSIEEVQKWELGLMASFKAAEQKIYTLTFQGQNKVDKNSQNIESLSELMLTYVPIQQFYIKSKMEHSKKILSIRKKIQEDLSLAKIFNFLEVQTKFDPFIRHVKHKTIKELANERKDLPFNEALSALQALNFGVSQIHNIKLITEFTKSLLTTYKESCSYEEPVLDMDNQLPITIYCILACFNPQLKPIIQMLAAYLQVEDSCENEKRALAALNASLDFVMTEWTCTE